jgi:hypothetical protein
MITFVRRINQKLPRILGILKDRSEGLSDNEFYRWQIIRSIWNEPLN